MRSTIRYQGQLLPRRSYKPARSRVTVKPGSFRLLIRARPDQRRTPKETDFGA